MGKKMKKRKRLTRPVPRLAKAARKAAAKVRQHPLFHELKKYFSGSRRHERIPGRILQRAELTYQLCNEGHFSERAVAAALRVDAGTIGRDCDIARLSDAEKEEIRNGGNATTVLEAARLKSAKPERPPKVKARPQKGSGTPSANASLPITEPRLIDSRGLEQRRDSLKEEIIGWFHTQGATQAVAKKTLNAAIPELDRRYFRGQLRLQQLPSTDPATVIASTQPQLESPVPQDEYYCQWLLSWAPAVQPNFAVVSAAMKRALSDLSRQLPPAVERSLQERRDLNQCIREFGPQLIKHPQSKWRHVGQAEVVQQQQEQAQADEEARRRTNTEKTRKLMGWPGPPEPAAGPGREGVVEDHAPKQPLPAQAEENFPSAAAIVQPSASSATLAIDPSAGEKKGGEPPANR